MYEIGIIRTTKPRVPATVIENGNERYFTLQNGDLFYLETVRNDVLYILS